MTVLLRAIGTWLVTFLLASAAPVNASVAASPIARTPIYGYDGQHHFAPSTGSTTKRGPPGADYHNTTHHAVDNGSCLASTRQEAERALAVRPNAIVARWPDRELTPCAGAGVAAETAAAACSFAGSTVVLMADGSRKLIENVEVGDKVIATDPETGEQEAKMVEHVIVHEDTVVDLIVDGAVITTTEDHPYWSVTDQRFERADELEAGEKVRSADGSVITVSGLELGGERRTLAYNLSVEGIHTYHVGESEVLVHNVCPLKPVNLPA